MGEAVVLVPATRAALPALARTALPAWACARGQRGAAAEEALEASQVSLCQRLLAVVIWRAIWS